MAKPTHKYSIEGKPVYPHFKLTNERFPRVLATRLIEKDGADYFGAFLNRTNARILLDQVNKIFRLRSCDIRIDGIFNYPCTMYYKRRCVAPCVSELCSDAAYSERVQLVRLFLNNERELLREVIRLKIEAAAADLDFETASKWRDMMQEIEDYWENSRVAPWTDGTSDTFEIRFSGAGVDLFLVSQKARRVLGERVFSFPDATESEAADILADVIDQFYRFHAPKEVRVPIDLKARQRLQKALSARFERPIRIRLTTDKNRRISTDVAVYKSTTELDLSRLLKRPSPKAILKEIGALFDIEQMPKRISALDVSHISGTDQVAAAVGWKDGEFVPDATEYLFSENSSEPGAMAELVAERYQDADVGEVVLVDGGIAQLNAAAGALPDGSKVVLIGAVKPPGEHSEISYFLARDGRRIEFDPTSAAMSLLQRLRDEVHDFANSVHRETREYAHFYEMVNIFPSLTEPERQRLLRHFGSSTRAAASSSEELREVLGDERGSAAGRDVENYRTGSTPRVKPLVVPIRFREENAAAEDLRPINSASGKARPIR